MMLLHLHVNLNADDDDDDDDDDVAGNTKQLTYVTNPLGLLAIL